MLNPVLNISGMSIAGGSAGQLTWIDGSPYPNPDNWDNFEQGQPDNVTVSFLIFFEFFGVVPLMQITQFIIEITRQNVYTYPEKHSGCMSTLIRKQWKFCNLFKYHYALQSLSKFITSNYRHIWLPN